MSSWAKRNFVDSTSHMTFEIFVKNIAHKLLTLIWNDILLVTANRNYGMERMPLSHFAAEPLFNFIFIQIVKSRSLASLTLFLPKVTKDTFYLGAYHKWLLTPYRNKKYKELATRTIRIHSPCKKHTCFWETFQGSFIYSQSFCQKSA